jgi:hypothetical protein
MRRAPVFARLALCATVRRMNLRLATAHFAVFLASCALSHERPDPMAPEDAGPEICVEPTCHSSCERYAEGPRAGGRCDPMTFETCSIPSRDGCAIAECRAGEIAHDRDPECVPCATCR